MGRLSRIVKVNSWYGPVSHNSPVNCGRQIQVAPVPFSTHVPLLSQVTSSHVRFVKGILSVRATVVAASVVVMATDAGEADRGKSVDSNESAVV